MPPAPLRLLVCDDSPTYAAGLRRLVEHGHELEVVAVHGNAEDAIAALPELAPDLITMDFELPGMNGLEAVERIMDAHPLPILVLSSRTTRGGATAAAACAAGALQAISKDDLNLLEIEGESAVAFRRRLRVLASAPVIRHPRAGLRRSGSHVRPARRDLQVIGVCASAGGPQALMEMVSALPESFDVPILVVQHIAEGFTDQLVAWLGRSAQVPVRLAEHGAPLLPGVSIAPENKHLTLAADYSLALGELSSPTLYCPSGDVLLHSLAEHVGSGAAGIVLSGMGSDGADGLAALRVSGGLTIAQDEASSGVFGMPKVAAQRGAEHVLPPQEIAASLIALAG